MQYNFFNCEISYYSLFFIIKKISTRVIFVLFSDQVTKFYDVSVQHSIKIGENTKKNSIIFTRMK